MGTQTGYNLVATAKRRGSKAVCGASMKIGVSPMKIALINENSQAAKGGELNLEYVFEKLFGFGHGQGYPPERVEPEMRNKRILDEVRAKTLRPLLDGLKDIDQELVKGAVAGERFQELFFAGCRDQAVADYVRSLL